MERTIEARLRQKIRAAGGLALKLVCPGFTGMPDRLILLPGGRVIFAETKDTGKTPRPRQRRVHALLRELGFPVYVLDSPAAVDQLVREVTGG